jgi:MarR family transcriptional regulator, organic hydroperoxide resistance regulator
MAAERNAQPDAASRVWRALYDAILDIHDRNIAVLTSRGLTGGEIKALLKLAPGEAVPMRGLADRWRSDGSTVTWMADRLESKGLVQRRAQPGDRRVRAVALTPKGERELAAIQKQLFQPPSWWRQLSDREIKQLAATSERLRTHVAPGAGD